MTKQVKRVGCSTLKDLVETEKLIITDFESIQELSTFVARKSSYEADDGCYDDLAMTLVLFAWLTYQPFFKDLTNTDFRARLSEERLTAMYDNLLQPGFIDDGHDEARPIDNLGDRDHWTLVEPTEDIIW